jgi:hypothetical protein
MDADSHCAILIENTCAMFRAFKTGCNANVACRRGVYPLGSCVSRTPSWTRHGKMRRVSTHVPPSARSRVDTNSESSRISGVQPAANLISTQRGLKRDNRLLCRALSSESDFDSLFGEIDRIQREMDQSVRQDMQRFQRSEEQLQTSARQQPGARTLKQERSSQASSGDGGYGCLESDTILFRLVVMHLTGVYTLCAYPTTFE